VEAVHISQVALSAEKSAALIKENEDLKVSTLSISNTLFIPIELLFLKCSAHQGMFCSLNLDGK
jgi:hypothetical protein